MTYREIATVSFVDGESGSEAFAVVRQRGRSIALGISIKSDGDIDVLLDVHAAAKLLEAMKSGIEAIEAGQ
jgi:hypothetical protein